MRTLRLLFLMGLLAPGTARAEEPRCPLDVATCLSQYQAMKERPWMGVTVDRDSLGRRLVVSVVPGSPAERTGIRAGDELESIEGKPPAEWFAGRAGWRVGDRGEVKVRRGGRERSLVLRFQPIPEDVLARIIGVHMLEGHLAHLSSDRESGQH